jgi:hypothetical protein
MLKKFSKGIETFFNPNDPKQWEIAIKLREDRAREMEAPDFAQKEQKKMKKLGFNITITEDMMGKEFLKTKEELNFAKIQLQKLADRTPLSISTKQLNIFGLICDIIGAFLIWRYGLPQEVSREGAVYLVTETFNEAEKTKAKRLDWLSRLGLLLLIVGFFFQLLSNFF